MHIPEGARWIAVQFLSCAALCGASVPGTPPFHGSAALAATKQAVAYGERPSGSEAVVKLRSWIVSQVKPLGGELSMDTFTAQTPTGPVPMSNVVLKFAGSSGKAVVVTGHYDTKRIPMMTFLGANDGGSSTGFLVEFARVAAAMKHRDDLYLVFFDGEEAVATWTDTDSRYGSRHLAVKWLQDGTLRKIKALINIDMVGDKDLDLANDENSSSNLRNQVRQIANRLGTGKYLREDQTAIDDDHKPFVDLGVNAVDLIDLDYGPNGSYWHTAADTTDKLSARSLQVVGDITIELVKELDAQN